MGRPLIMTSGTQAMQIRIAMEQYTAMKTIQETEGIPLAAQIRLALDAWLAARGGKGKGKR
jgi:hypothetical protein